MATTHKLSKTKIYTIWNAMNMRCTKPSQDSYQYYGARGIKVCDRWKSFENFYSDMGKGYKPGLSIDRIDVNKDYSPDNCKWATAIEQARNTTRTKWVTIGGVTKNLSAWIEKSSVKSSTVRQRYYVCGWTIEDALFTPTASRGRRIAS